MQLVTRQPAFPMRAIRAMVCFLPVAQNRQHPLRIVRRARDDRGHQKLCLRQRQCRSVFLTVRAVAPYVRAIASYTGKW